MKVISSLKNRGILMKETTQKVPKTTQKLLVKKEDLSIFLDH